MEIQGKWSTAKWRKRFNKMRTKPEHWASQS